MLVGRRRSGPRRHGAGSLTRIDTSAARPRFPENHERNFDEPSVQPDRRDHDRSPERSEEHTSELQSLMRISYAVFCLKKKKKTILQSRQEHTNNNYNNT